MSSPDSIPKVCLDVSEVVKLLCAVGFSVRHLDISEPYDVTPTGVSGQERRGGCRVVVSCTTSGLRAVLETVGEECRCTSKQLNMAASNTQVERVITPLSDPVSLILREFLVSLTKYGIQRENTACTNIADSLANKCTVVEEQKQTPNLQVHTGLGSRRNIFGSVDQLLTSSVPDLPLQKGREMSSCPSSPVPRDKIRVEVSQSSPLEALSTKQSSSQLCRALYSSPDIRQADDIERRLKLAATCIQEALALHHHNITDPRNDKKSLSTSNLYKVPNIPSSKKKSPTAVSQRDHHSSVAGKPTKPRPLTPYSGKKTKPIFPDKTSTPRGPSTSTMGRLNVGANRRRTPNPSGP
ncbi:uncharacterized protein LOC111873401 [Cryptotermes secundus]|uniref:uncharacterized protein LOC111873401 n=1 Tax=Cryptotermes secundus TaxID=105785 RepID=UPI000CD7CD39|nr:uncharacterized protein LOC111873401 [Cryptotermes secundus]